MPDYIRGKSGEIPEVREDRLLTDTVAVTHIGMHSQTHQSAYSAHMHLTVNASATDEYIGYFQYTGDSKLFIDTIIFCTDSAGVTSFKVHKNPTYSSGGTVVVPDNLDFSTSATLPVTVYGQEDTVGSPIVFSDLPSEQMCFRKLGADTLVVDMKDALILRKNNSISFTAKATSGDKIRVTLLYFEGEN